MTAVAAAPVMNTNHDSGTETGTEHSPSRFTAVNGREPGSSGNPLPPATHHGERGASAGPKPTLNPFREHPGERYDPDPEDQLSQRSSPEAPVHNKHKRKRSESGEHASRRNSEQGPSAGRGPINRPEVSGTPSANGAGPGSVSEMESGNAVAPSGPRSDSHEASQASVNGPWPTYDAQLVNQAQRAQQMDVSDAHLADVLQRDTQGQDSGQRNVHSHRPTSSTPGVQPASSPAYSSERAATTVQVAPKRKRVFSNRTKTGCMTCRRRKKKCDEQHPACE